VVSPYLDGLMALSTVACDLPCGPSAPQRAREWAQHQLTRDAIRPFGIATALIDDVLLCLSELVTNAIEADCDELSVELALEDSQIRVSVLDDGDGWPTLLRPAITDFGGRGLMIVNALARNWGAESAGPSKRVWAELRSTAG